jgi:solute carrier family 25 thiamine pyrophosphate transporter 19
MPSLVGYHPDGLLARLTPSDHVAAGAVSSALTRMFCQPLDVLKIRMQLQVERGREAKYRSMRGAVAKMVKEEGIYSFWKGHLPAQYLSVSYGVFQFGAFQVATKSLYEWAPWTAEPRFRPVCHFVLGGMAGVAGTLSSYPFDVVRTRLVAQGNARAYGGTLDAAAKMLKNEGPGSFYRGLVPTLATIVPYSGLQFGFYSFFNQIFDPLFATDRVLMSKSVLCGGLAGLCAKTVVFPFDTTKKRLQVQGFESGRKELGRTHAYSGMMDCMRKTVRREGIRGLYKGLTPGLAKAVATTAMNFWLFEVCCQIVALRHLSDDEKE